LPEAYRRIIGIRVITPVVAILTFVAALCVPFVANGSQALDATIVICLAIVGVSVVIITGLGGQLSLAQFAYAAVGAAVSIRVSEEFGFIAGIAAGAVIAASLSFALALPALRVRGLQLGVASLIFAVVTTAWLLDRPFLLGEAEPAVRPSLEIAGIDTSTSRGYYWIALLALVLVMAFAQRLRSGAWGRVLVAVRDNEEQARALSIPARNMKLQAAAVGGFIAGIGGAIYGHSLSNIGSVNFPVQSSIDAIKAAWLLSAVGLWTRHTTPSPGAGVSTPLLHAPQVHPMQRHRVSTEPTSAALPHLGQHPGQTDIRWTNHPSSRSPGSPSVSEV
jgi:ABC-type branched-subunit amino acid transport system permease subunit